MNNEIMIIDFGRSARLIAQRVMKFGRSTKIVAPSISLKKLEEAEGIILSGSPYDIRHQIATVLDPRILELGIPILGIYFGAQLITVLSGGKVETKKEQAEKGKFEAMVLIKNRLLHGLHDKEVVWMDHGDSITEVPKDFIVTARTENCIAAIEHIEKPIFAVQFHPEYIKTKCGDKLFKNFLSICREQREK